MITRAIAAVLCATIAFVRQSPPRDAAVQRVVGTATVTGTVLTGATGSEPARKARVMLNSQDGRGVGLTAATNDEGRFEFRSVPAGRYTVESYKPGYLRAFFGATRPNRAGTPIAVADGGRLEGLTIRLPRGAAISGTVRDAGGRPMVGVSVGAYRYGYSTLGERRLSSYAFAVSDDRGEYRVWGLPPGDYVVAATPQAPGALLATRADFALLTVAEVDRLLQGGRPDVSAPNAPPVPTGNYAPVFYPATTDPTSAVTFTLAAGDERDGVDLAVTLLRTARVTGVVGRPDGQPVGSASVRLSRAGEAANLLGESAAFRSRTVSLANDGRFMLEDIAPGNYRVLVQSTPARAGAASNLSQPRTAQWAMSEIAVNGENVAVSLTMQPAMTIAGRVVFDGTSPPPENVTAMQVFLVPPGNVALNAGPPGGALAADGTFQFTDVTPNDYRLQTVVRTRWTGDWWLRSATAGGRDALIGQLPIRPGENMELVLTFTDKPSELSGRFQDATGRPATDYFLVVFPADKALRSVGARRIVDVRPANDGSYVVRGLPTGDYLLAALTDLDPEDLNTPSFLDELARLAVRVTLAEGRVTRQDLQVGR